MGSLTMGSPSYLEQYLVDAKGEFEHPAVEGSLCSLKQPMSYVTVWQLAAFAINTPFLSWANSPVVSRFEKKIRLPRDD
jgi:hypothetical protein